MTRIIMMGNSIAEYAEVIQLASNQLSRETVVTKGLGRRVRHQSNILLGAGATLPKKSDPKTEAESSYKVRKSSQHVPSEFSLEGKRFLPVSTQCFSS